MGRPRKHPRRYYRCIESFGGTDPDTGLPIGGKKGEIWPEGERLNKCRQFFEPLDSDYPVEQAAGEKRDR